MKSFVITLMFIAIVYIGCSKQDSLTEEKYINQTKKLAKKFMTNLQSKLKQAIKERGTHGAIEVCKEASPTLENDFSKKYPNVVKVRRISLKPRNLKDHTPTKEEEAWLLKQEKKTKDNQPLKPGIIKSKNTINVLLPISITKGVCLKCHGQKDNLSQKLKDAINKHYPNDKAIDYKLKDLRGALSVTWKK